MAKPVTQEAQAVITLLRQSADVTGVLEGRTVPLAVGGGTDRSTRSAQAFSADRVCEGRFQRPEVNSHGFS